MPDQSETFAIGLPDEHPNLLLVSITVRHSTCAEDGGAFPGKAAITRAALGIGVYAGAFGLTFGAVAAASGSASAVRFSVPWSSKARSVGSGMVFTVAGPIRLST